MQRNRLNTILLIIILPTLLLLFIGGGVYFYLNSGFRIIGTNHSKVFPSSSRVLTYEFSEEVAGRNSQPEDFVVTEPDIPSSIDIHGRFLTITFDEGPKIDTVLVVRFNDILSNSNSAYHAEFKYKVDYIPFSELPESAQSEQIQSSTIASDSNPILSKLPHDEISFRINYEIDQSKYGKASSWQAEKDNYRIIIYTYALKDEKNLSQYKEKTNYIRQKALEWIREQGVDPDKDITIVFSPSDDELDGGQNQAGD